MQTKLYDNPPYVKRLKLVSGTEPTRYMTPHSCFSSCLILQSFGRFSGLNIISCGYVMEVKILSKFTVFRLAVMLSKQTHFASFHT